MVGRRSFPFGFRPIFRCELLVSGRVSQYLLEISCFLKTNLQLFQSIFLLGCLIITTKVMQDGVVKQFHHTHHKTQNNPHAKKKVTIHFLYLFFTGNPHVFFFFEGYLRRRTPAHVGAKSPPGRCKKWSLL